MRTYHSLLLVLCFLLLSCNDRKSSEKTDFLINDSMTRSELMGMGITEYRSVLRDVSPELKYKIWALKIQDVLDHWDLSDEEKEIGRRILKDMSPETFKGATALSFSSAAELYDHLMQTGTPSVQIHLFMAYEIPQTLDDLKTLIHRSDYANMKAECEKDPHMKKLLGL